MPLQKRHGDWAPPGPGAPGYGRGAGRFAGRRGRYSGGPPHGGPPREMFAADRPPRGHFPGRGPTGRREPGQLPPTPPALLRIRPSTHSISINGLCTTSFRAVGAWPMQQLGVVV